MSSTTSTRNMTVTIVIIARIVVVGIWFFINQPAASITTTNVPTQAAPQAQTGTPQAAASTTTNSNVAQIQGSGSSDASLDQDSASIDQQLGGLNSDTSAAQQ